MSNAKHTAEFIAKCSRYATGRAGARRLMIGKTAVEALNLGPLWRPTIAGDLFKPSNEIGFKTRQEALDDARQIKGQCRAELAKATAAQS